MKRIIDTTTKKVKWRGPAYIVEGVEIFDVPAPLVLATDVIVEPPEHDSATQKLVRIPDALVGDEWRMNQMKAVDLTPEELEEKAILEARKEWHNVTAFWDEFTQDEIYAITNSDHPMVKMLVTSLAMWRSTVWSDDPRIQQGLGLLQSVGLLTEERIDTITSKEE